MGWAILSLPSRTADCYRRTRPAKTISMSIGCGAEWYSAWSSEARQSLSNTSANILRLRCRPEICKTKAIGIVSASRLRKHEREKAIKVFLKTGKIETPTQRGQSTSGAGDLETLRTRELRFVGEALGTRTDASLLGDLRFIQTGIDGPS